MLETETRAVDVTHVLLSHLHYDDCMDYLRLVLQPAARLLGYRKGPARDV